MKICKPNLLQTIVILISFGFVLAVTDHAGAALPSPYYRGGDGRYFEYKDTGVKIYYEVINPNQTGEPLFLLHGGFEDSGSWHSDLITSLSANFKVIIVDSRGHGKSLNPSNDISYKLMATDLYNVISDALNDSDRYKEINFLGWSDGGIAAMYFCILNELQSYDDTVNVNKAIFFGVNVDYKGLTLAVRSAGMDYYDKKYGLDYTWPAQWTSFRDNILSMWKNGPYLPNINNPLAKMQNMNVLVLAAKRHSGATSDTVVKIDHMQGIAKKINNSEPPYKEVIRSDHLAPTGENSNRFNNFKDVVLEFLGGASTFSYTEIINN